MYNPSLRQEPRYEPAAVIPLTHDSSLLDWLRAEGRLMAREKDDRELLLEEDQDLSELMDGDDHYDLDDDDDIEIDIEEDA